MVALTEAELTRRLLGCGDGSASFSGEAKARGQRIASCDPLYPFLAGNSRQRVRVWYDPLIVQIKEARKRGRT